MNSLLQREADSALDSARRRGHGNGRGLLARHADGDAAAELLVHGGSHNQGGRDVWKSQRFRGAERRGSVGLGRYIRAFFCEGVLIHIIVMVVTFVGTTWLVSFMAKSPVDHVVSRLSTSGNISSESFAAQLEICSEMSLKDQEALVWLAGEQSRAVDRLRQLDVDRTILDVVLSGCRTFPPGGNIMTRLDNFDWERHELFGKAAALQLALDKCNDRYVTSTI